MTTLKDASLSHTAKKELYHLDSVPVDIEMQEGSFTNKEGKEVKYNFVEIEGYQYTVKAKVLAALKSIVQARPDVKNVQFQKTETGEIIVIPLD